MRARSIAQLFDVFAVLSGGRDFKVIRALRFEMPPDRSRPPQNETHFSGYPDAGGLIPCLTMWTSSLK